MHIERSLNIPGQDTALQSELIILARLYVAVNALVNKKEVVSQSLVVFFRR